MNVNPVYVRSRHLGLLGTSAQQSLVLSYISARLMAGLPMFLKQVPCCERLINSEKELLQSLLAVCAMKSRATWSMHQLNEMSVVLHSCLANAQEPLDLADTQDETDAAGFAEHDSGGEPKEEDRTKLRRQEEVRGGAWEGLSQRLWGVSGRVRDGMHSTAQSKCLCVYEVHVTEGHKVSMDVASVWKDVPC